MFQTIVDEAKRFLEELREAAEYEMANDYKYKGRLTLKFIDMLIVVKVVLLCLLLLCLVALLTPYGFNGY